MTEFKTKAGTILPLISLKGKPYLQVAHRLVWFREERPDAGIETECVESNDKYARYKATIRNESGKILAQGTKVEHFTHFADAHEKAETGSIGRALAMCGYGTQFCEADFEELPRIVDAPVQPIAKVAQLKPVQVDKPLITTDKHGEHVIKFGALTGRKVSDLSDDEASTYCTKFRIAMTKGPIPKDAMDDFTAVKQYFGYDI